MNNKTNQPFILKTIKESFPGKARRIFAANSVVRYFVCLSFSLTLSLYLSFFFINISNTSADVAEPHLGGSART